MRITIAPTGEVTVDTDDAAQAVALIAALRNGTPPKRRRQKREHIPEDVHVSPPLAQTWDYLVAHDSPEGLSAVLVAEGLGLNVHTTNWRLGQLVKKALAHKVAVGRYRAGEG